jgi:hypothetical protein
MELRALGIDINAPSAKTLWCALTLWGEELAALRAEQTLAVIDEALRKVRARYVSDETRIGESAAVDKP